MNFNFYNWVRDYEQEIPGLMEELEIEIELENKIGKYTLKEWIRKSCNHARISSQSKKTNKYIYLGMDNIREAIAIFNANEEIIQISEEKSFNEVFSQEFVEWLMGFMYDKNNNVPLCVYIAPVRAQLCKDEEQGRDINNKSYKWCYNKDFRLTISKLEKEINNKKKYGKIFKPFEFFSGKLNNILKSVSV